ncbi:SUMF1/EgtB/PvdO family nonheme iron enzyme [Staphylococcus kloosii]|uniref:SUMF1/EgtB/PvdO family nonheme iron enzyme n=1 Tax=Staphylococcus kloosii TaxID=29384 RepID=UPI0028A4E59A|nr:SUMF1/EgtB/PvdO family nonheme iron enzyme [Staphylococcus kloosii]MDT3960062.1 SUMF1/EgtB/PvdO family nonheme iron enzyme [Staphylococcus kloosii]
MLYKSSENLKKYNEDMDYLISVEEILNNIKFNNKLEVRKKAKEILGLSENIKHFAVAEQLFGIAISFQNSFIRAVLIDFIKLWIPYSTAIETIVHLTHDPDDIVSFKAMEVCGEERLELSIPYLSNIVGDITERNNPRKPVGLGAQVVVSNLLKIYNCQSEEELYFKKAYYDKKLKLENKYKEKINISRGLKEKFKSLNEENMIYIEEGFFNYGINEDEIIEKEFSWSDNTPKEKVWLPSYFIDKNPVSNAEYDEFSDFIETYGHIFCHPNEPKNKNHRRNTYYDERYKDQHPVSGIDYYDAYAYSKWKGKSLPSEFQWEKAAKGNAITKWPWGKQFDEKKVLYSGTLLGKKPESITEWHNGLLELFNKESLLSENVNIIRNQSSYGVNNMLGGNWEWTKSDYFSKRMFYPSFTHNHEKFNQFGVLKGGSFYSHPEQMYPSFRGKDIPFCRHDEMGFRCVKEIPLPLLRKENNNVINNKAIY